MSPSRPARAHTRLAFAGSGPRSPESPAPGSRLPRRPPLPGGFGAAGSQPNPPQPNCRSGAPASDPGARARPAPPGEGTAAESSLGRRRLQERWPRARRAAGGALHCGASEHPDLPSPGNQRVGPTANGGRRWPRGGEGPGKCSPGQAAPGAQWTLGKVVPSRAGRGSSPRCNGCACAEPAWPAIRDRAGAPPPPGTEPLSLAGSFTPSRRESAPLKGVSVQGGGSIPL